MSDSVAKAYETQLANIEQRTGKSLPELTALLGATGLTKHGQLRDHLKAELGMGHGDANALVHHFLSGWSAETVAPEEAGDILDAVYTGGKAGLRPIHDALMALVVPLGDFSIAPKKGYVSLRRKRQFAMIGPGSQSRVDVGINLKGVDGNDRVVAQAPGGMCTHQIRLTSVDQVDGEVVEWLRRAYDAAG